jgi:uncharacterized protein involved in exopolysaccharide biosynthesis
MGMNPENPLPSDLPSGMMKAWLLPFQPAPPMLQGPTPMDYVWEIKRRWKILLAFTILSMAAATAVALLATPIWRANVLVTIRPQSGTEGISRSLLSQFGGLANIAGLTGAGSSNDTEPFAVLQSRETADKFIASNNLLPILLYKKWDATIGNWKKDSDGPPTLADGYKYFTKYVIKIGQDRKTGIVTLTIDWRDRELAANWANAFIKFADDSLRERNMDESRATIEYLDAQLKSEQSVPIRESLFQMLEGQQRTLVYAKTRREFAFRVIDPAVVPERRERLWPKRRILVGAGAAGGFAFGLAFVCVAMYFRKSRRTEALKHETD